MIKWNSRSFGFEKRFPITFSEAIYTRKNATKRCFKGDWYITGDLAKIDWRMDISGLFGRADDIN